MTKRVNHIVGHLLQTTMDVPVGHTSDRIYNFPPFPPPPPDVEIISFDKFVEFGIIVGEDGIERDGQGIATNGTERS